MLSMGFAKELNAILELAPERAPGPLLQRDDPAGHRAPGARRSSRIPSSSRSRATRSARSKSNHFVYLVPSGDKRQRARPHHRGRGSRERDRLLQHEGRDRARRRGASSARLRRRLAQRRSRAERARARHAARRARASSASSSRPTSPRAASTSRTSRTSSTPTSRSRRAVRPPHGPHGPRGPHGHGDLARRAEGHRQPLHPAAHVQDPADREAAPERGRAEDARRGRHRRRCSPRRTPSARVHPDDLALARRLLTHPAGGVDRRGAAARSPRRAQRGSEGRGRRGATREEPAVRNRSRRVHKRSAPASTTPPTPQRRCGGRSKNGSPPRGPARVEAAASRPTTTSRSSRLLGRG